MPDNDLVTICITTYSRKNLVVNTVKSVQNQTYRNIEIIVVDDASIDETEDVLKSFIQGDSRIKYLKHSENRGLAAARNTAIFNASGKYFSFIDDDDEWDSTYIEEFVQLVQNYDENWCFCCGFIQNNRNFVPDFEGTLKDIIYQGYTPPVAGQFYFLNTVKAVNGYNEDINSGVDHDLWIKLAIKGIKIKSLKKALAIPNNDSNQGRMTINYNKRIRGIQQSLDIWKDDIYKHFGEKFYKHFRNNYIYHIHKKVLLSHIKNKSLFESIFYFFLQPEKIRFMKDLSIIITRKHSKISKTNKKLNYVILPVFKTFKYKS